MSFVTFHCNFVACGIFRMLWVQTRFWCHRSSTFHPCQKANKQQHNMLGNNSQHFSINNQYSDQWSFKWVFQWQILRSCGPTKPEHAVYCCLVLKMGGNRHTSCFVIEAKPSVCSFMVCPEDNLNTLRPCEQGRRDIPSTKCLNVTRERFYLGGMDTERERRSMRRNTRLVQILY